MKVAEPRGTLLIPPRHVVAPYNAKNLAQDSRSISPLRKSRGPHVLSCFRTSSFSPIR